MERITNNGTAVTHLLKSGNSRYMLVPAHAMRHMGWRDADTFVWRFAGEKAIVERVAVEKMAMIRTAELERPI